MKQKPFYDLAIKCSDFRPVRHYEHMRNCWFCTEWDYCTEECMIEEHQRQMALEAARRNPNQTKLTEKVSQK